ncbi:serine hydrolase [Clavibacter zhangzhiyongii]|uniref:serine hydrolase n=1 Tax=Clavibacter zhangzhiyongii TaxID=2768071 RepID=UPI0039E198BF
MRRSRPSATTRRSSPAPSPTSTRPPRATTVTPPARGPPPPCSARTPWAARGRSRIPSTPTSAPSSPAGWTATQTGDTLVRAELPTDWTVGDKSGSGAYASRGDVAVVWRPDAAPIVIAVHSSKDRQDADADDALISGAAKAAVEALGALG